jgi:hypothetical protein
VVVFQEPHGSFPRVVIAGGRPEATTREGRQMLGTKEAVVFQEPHGPFPRVVLAGVRPETITREG